MSETIHKEDLREKIIDELINTEKYYHDDTYRKELIFDAMDSYFTIRAKELLEWMGKHNVDCVGQMDDKYWPAKNCFTYKGKWVTAEQLFENFL